MTSTNLNLHQFSWPASRLGEALEALARKSGFPVRSVDLGQEAFPDDDWIVTAAGGLGLEIEPVEIPYPAIERQLQVLGPAVLRLPGNGQRHFLAVLRGSRKLRVLGPDLAVRRLPMEPVRAALCLEVEASLLPEVDRLLNEASVAGRQQRQARRVILRQRLGWARIGGCWLIRFPPGIGFRSQLQNAGVFTRLASLGVAHAAQFSLWILAWWMVGQGALQGRLDRGWLLAWVLILLTIVPLRLLTTWLEGMLAIGVGGLLKQRLLYGALQLEPEKIRHQGSGQLLGCVIESEAVESLALSGGLLGLVAGIELIMAAGVLGLGAGGWVHALLLLAWVATTLVMGWLYWGRYRRWTEARLSMTYDLVECMAGHRTRLAQQAPEHWHDGEDQAVERYLGLSTELDQTGVLLLAVVPRGWLIIGLLGLAPSFVSGSGSPAGLAVGIGGILLGHRALKRLSVGLQHLVGACISWKQVAPLFHSANDVQNERTAPSSTSAVGTIPTQPNSAVLEAYDLVFRYPGRNEPVLDGCGLRIKMGDRLLLEGPSGGGKSTLASLLTCLRVPQSGLLLLGGLDRQTLGTEAWRKRVCTAPQFHENHVLTATFSFNLLMGRCWPPRPQDLKEAETICQQLGLDELLRRMPAGLLQMVGETGWQLSHGERSRLYIARALLQGSDLVVLDESFASLDPENLRKALSCVLDRAGTILVIAHP